MTIAGSFSDAAGAYNMVFTLGLRHTLALWQRAMALVQFPQFRHRSLRSGRCRKNLPLADTSELSFTLSDLDAVKWTGTFDAVEPDSRHYFEQELEREVCDSHVLAGQRVTALAQGGNGDDIVFFVHATPARLAVVHLTYSRTRETSPDWPSTGMFDSIADMLASIADI